MAHLFINVPQPHCVKKPLRNFQHTCLRCYAALFRGNLELTSKRLPRLLEILRIAAPKVFMSHNYHTAACSSETTHQGKATVNSLGLAAGLLHSNVKVQQIVISCSTEASW